MFNIMLDKHPTEAAGYLFRSDFRTAIMIMQCLNDPELEDGEKAAIAFDLFYGSGIPQDLEWGMKTIIWFLKCGKESIADDQAAEEVLDYDHDDRIIWSAFMRTYGIDLSKDKMHWWAFCALLSDIGECALTEIIKIRTKKYDNNTTAEERSYYNRLKNKYAIPKVLTEDQKEADDEFMRLLREGEEGGKL